MAPTSLLPVALLWLLAVLHFQQQQPQGGAALALSMGSGGGYMARAPAASGPVQKRLGGVSGTAGDINQAPAGSSSKFLPDGISRTDKLQAFLECRKECIAKCDRLVYVYSTKKEFCHDCLRQCMIAILQQARSLGIDFSIREEKMQGDSPASEAGGAASLDKRERRRRRRQQKKKKKNKRGRRDRRHRRERKGKQRQQALLKNCIVH